MPVRVEREGPVSLIVIDRPHVKNAVDRATADALATAFRAFESDPDARVAVLAGEGGTFCAGADLRAIAEGRGNRVEPMTVGSADPTHPQRVENGDGPMGPTRLLLSKPTIAAIDGHAVGGGMELALWCDLRVMEETATMGFLNRRWGVPLVDGGSVRLPRLIGLSRAMDLILTGREIGAAEAERIGLAQRVVAPGYARRVALEMARALAALPQAALRGDRASAHEQAGLALADALANEFRRGGPALARETGEGARAFVSRDRLPKS